jgi:hypothetical protein
MRVVIGGPSAYTIKFLKMNPSMHVCTTDFDDPVPHYYTHMYTCTHLPKTVSLPALSGPSMVPSVSTALHEYCPACPSCTEGIVRERVDPLPLETVMPSRSHSMTARLFLYVVE